MSDAGPILVSDERVELDGVRLELRRWPGDGVPILMLHEGLGSVTMWRDFPERLARRTRRPVIAWSRRGHGASDPLPEAREPDYMHKEADRIPRLLDRLGLARAHLLGHSDGGSIALILASTHPARVASLILEAPHVFVEALTVESIGKARAAYVETDLGRRLARYHRDPNETFWRWNDIWLDPCFRDWNIEDLLPKIEAPALLIQGLEDEYGTLAQLDRIEAGVAAACRLELAGCGHSPHRDRPEAVIDAIFRFLPRDCARQRRTSAEALP